MIGIDLGTTYSLCAVFTDGKPQLIPNAFGAVLTPSIVGVSPSGEILIGQPAKDLKITMPERCASRFKRLMGTQDQVTLAERRFTPTELSALILKSLKQDAEAFLKAEVSDVVITVPAYFNENQRRATIMAGEIAGLSVKRIINEPTAAALTYGFHQRQADSTLLVLDLGGGTFDVTLMQVFEGTYEIVSTAGEGNLGGEDFTDRLVSRVLSMQNLSYELAELKSPKLVARLFQACEQAKREMTHQSSVTLRIPNEEGNYEEQAVSLTVTRDEFKEHCQVLMDRVKQPVLRVLRDARTDLGKIDQVILVGGATRMTMMTEFVQETLKKDPLCQFNPDEVVALGASVQAALIADDAAVRDLVLTDVCPFSLGVETCKEFGNNELRQGYFLPIIHRNSTIPISREQYLETVVANQTQMNLKVYQGEARRTEDNLLLGTLRVDGIPTGAKGKSVRVRFTYDMNGLLEVEARIEETGKIVSTVLTRYAGHLSDEDLQAAKAKLASYKYYPRDEQVNQQLLRFSERLVGEMPPHLREEFERLIDQFEQAMSSQNKEYFEASKVALIDALEQLGYDPHSQEDSSHDDQQD